MAVELDNHQIAAGINEKYRKPACFGAYSQVLVDGLRSNQSMAELNLSGCKISDEGVTVLAGIIKVR